MTYGYNDLTPVQRHGGFWVKRDDLLNIHGASGGKARTCWHLSATAKVGLTTAGSRKSPQVKLVATMASKLGLPCVAHTPTGDISTGPVAEAAALGATVVQHRPGHNSVIIKRARDYATEHGFTEIPFGMECEEAVTQTRQQVVNLPDTTERLVVCVGSGMSLSGVLHGLHDYDMGDVRVLGVCVGADPVKRLDKYAPWDWRFRVELVRSVHDYHVAVDGKVGSVQLDPIYEAKIVPYLLPGDTVWVVGHRDTIV